MEGLWDLGPGFYLGASATAHLGTDLYLGLGGLFLGLGGFLLEFSPIHLFWKGGEEV